MHLLNVFVHKLTSLKAPNNVSYVQALKKGFVYLLLGGRVVSIGITPWGIVDRRNELLGRKREVAFHPVAQPR